MAGYQSFFINHLNNYIKPKHFKARPRTVLFKRLKPFNPDKCRRWLKAPVEYLSHEESFSIGIFLALKEFNKEYEPKDFTQAFTYLNKCSLSNNKDIFSLSQMALGIICFNIAVKSPLKEQKKWLSLSHHYFEDSRALEDLDEIALFYQGLILIASDQLDMALKCFCSATKVSFNPSSINSIISKIYSYLGNHTKANEFNKQTLHNSIKVA